MPSVPGDGFQLILLLLLVLPGTVYQFVRARLRGPAPDDASALNRVLRALGMSALLSLLYTVTVGPPLWRLAVEASAAARQGEVPALRGFALWALVLLFIVPAGVALADHLRRIHVTTPGLLKLTYDPSYPGAWDFAFLNRGDCYVRLLTLDGRWIGGWMGDDCWVSSYPEPRELFIAQAHAMSEDGSFGPVVPGSIGMYVRCDDIRLIEFLDPSATAPS